MNVAGALANFLETDDGKGDEDQVPEEEEEVNADPVQQQQQSPPLPPQGATSELNQRKRNFTEEDKTLIRELFVEEGQAKPLSRTSINRACATNAQFETLWNRVMDKCQDDFRKAIQMIRPTVRYVAKSKK